MWKFFNQLASPPHFYRLAATLIPWLAIPGLLLIAWGSFQGLFVAPPDYQQGDAYRIIFVHVPSAYLSMMAYLFMAVGGVIGLIWRMKLAHAVAADAAPLGAAFTFLALATGSIWGRPMWGTWWEWDARMTSTLVQLFLYLGVIVIFYAIETFESAGKAASLTCVVGVVNIPIIKYSVNWWNTLHQPATFKITEAPAMPAEMWLPGLIMVIGFYALFGAVTFYGMQTEIIYRERRSRWIKDVLG